MNLIFFLSFLFCMTMGIKDWISYYKNLRSENFNEQLLFRGFAFISVGLFSLIPITY